MDWQTFAHIGSFVQSVVSALAIVIAGAWAYRKFTLYERHWMRAQAQPSLDVKVSVTVLNGISPHDCFLALISKIANRGRVHAVVDLDRSAFVVERITGVVAEPPATSGTDSERTIVDREPALDVQVSRFKVGLGPPGSAVIRAGASLSFSSICQVYRGLHRIVAEYAVSPEDLAIFKALVDEQFIDSYPAVWIAATIVDSRATTEAEAGS